MSKPASEGHVCIFHPRIPAIAAYRVMDTLSKQMFDYGLCPICNHRLKRQDSFKKDISDKLEELFNKLMKQEQEKKNDSGK